MAPAGHASVEPWPLAMSHEPWRVLLQVLADQFRHLEHVDGLLPAEHGLERLVRVDHAFVLLVLEAVLLDVGPELLRHFSARNRLRSDDFRESRARGHG